jgi:hypothetical protein
MTHHFWTLRQRGGLPLALAVAALLCAWTFDRYLVPAWQQQTDSMQVQALALQRQARDAQQAAGAALRQAAVPVVDLPSEEGVNARMADLLALAVRNGVAVQRMQRLGSDTGSSDVARTALSMPVRATYADLRRLLADALRQDAALALERVSLRRTKADAAELEGELQWVLFHRRQGAASP